MYKFLNAFVPLGQISKHRYIYRDGYKEVYA